MYGIKARNLALLIAVESWRWWRAQDPLNLEGRIFPWSVMKRPSVRSSL
jgi:hypothetical protein